MEIYLLAALLFLYVVTRLVLRAEIVRKIWTSAFICAGFLTALALFALRIKQQEVMLAADNLNWYFFLYAFGALTFALGLINMWIYRRNLWSVFFVASTAEGKEKSKEQKIK